MNSALRQAFPFFHQADNQAIVYLDNAATTQKPKVVIDCMNDYWHKHNANVHRASHSLAQSTTEMFEFARQQVADFIGAENKQSIIWTKGATESINLVADILGKGYLKKGQTILLSHLEHHANIVPWQLIAQQYDLNIKVMPIDANGVLMLNESLSMITEQVGLVAIGHVSNALGNINPIQPIISKAKKMGGVTLIDGAQAIAHLPVNVSELECDFYVFSGHKMYGPTGIGVLYGRKALLETLPPYQSGGEMIERVSFDGTRFQGLPFKYEPGTPNIAGVLGLSAAVTFMQQHRQQISQTEGELYQYLLGQMQSLVNCKLWGETVNSTCVQSFQLADISNSDLGILLNEQNIAIRTGHHCTMPLMQSLGVDGTCRASLACYNNQQDIDALIEAIRSAKQLSAQVPLSPTLEMPENHSRRTENQHTSSPERPLGELALAIKSANGWDNIYRQVMLAGKKLQKLSVEEKNPQTEVFGCETQVWVLCQLQGDRLVISADANSKIVRGLIALMIEALAPLSIADIQLFDLKGYLNDIGLGRHLSESRGNGLTAVMSKIRKYNV